MKRRYILMLVGFLIALGIGGAATQLFSSAAPEAQGPLVIKRVTHRKENTAAGLLEKSFCDLFKQSGGIIDPYADKRSLGFDVWQDGSDDDGTLKASVQDSLGCKVEVSAKPIADTTARRKWAEGQAGELLSQYRDRCK